MFSYRFIALVVSVLIGGVFLLAFFRPEFSTDRMLCPNVAKHLAISIHHYHSSYGQLPPQAVFDADGEAIHSWRTHLLPFLAALDHLYRWDEPWNGPLNERLARGLPVHIEAPPPDSAIKTMGPYDGPIDYAFSFRCSHAPAETQNLADFYAVVGDQTPWPPNRTCSFEDITDGLENTILIVESNTVNAYWSEPRDLRLDEMDFVVNGSRQAGISSVHRSGPIVVFCDGAVWRLNPRIEAPTMRALLTANGGEKIEREQLIADGLLLSP